ncbi:YrIlm family inverse autotransporter adhesin [Serratia sp. UGAL515B_01]|uniref:YrIlm family inverse autotransporter adhesin n=1 Tax=Serratia sp. UGAL515B_01 TaxID=2986763 RepID=UPI0029558FC9|nr:YrIlm family inverse autotransporter adhesin [Serratia sp. UGAL515B_01]WON75599.1 YrIlm family inverse autotransporter adhesin [Serratia sp. UGAL515B_01]
MRNLFIKKSNNTSPKSRRAKTISTQPYRIRLTAWFTLFFQLFFPLCLSFSPAIAASVNSHSVSSYVATTPYVLSSGENVETVAKKYGLSVDELKKLNQYRTFSKPFVALTVGDEIDVPRKRSPLLVDNHPSLPNENKLAGYAITGGTALANGNTSKSAEQLARSVVTNQFNDSVQQWLNQFGTARVQLGINDNFHLDGSALDVLVPAFDNQQNLLFTQLGLRNKDNRNTLNIGAGFRTLQNQWMYGINAFFDNDMSGNNHRFGLGAEAWTNYFKLSANSYFGLTDWHQSRDFADYNERPANGYDVRAEAYLPAYPQLGGKLMYEQYFGDEVALLGKDSRQKDPRALTVGINYTPFPLLTFGIEHRAGKGGQSDDSLNIQFNYRLGQSWQSHFDSSSVAASRTLSASRHDLVERNNNIVLDYQKQELIRLSLPESMTGEAHSTVTVTAQVTSKYGLDRIEWDSAELVASGGTLVPVSPQTVVITLPAYQKAHGINLYALSAVAYDRQGNMSPRASMQLNVIPGSAVINRGNLTVSRDNAVSNGVATDAVHAIVTDGANNPMPDQTVIFTADNNANVNTIVGKTGPDGIAIAEISSTRAGVSHITASVNDSSQVVSVNFLGDPDNLDPTISSLIAVPTTIIADGTSASTLKLTLKDRNKNLVPGRNVSFTSNLTNVNARAATTNVGPVTDHGDGTYTASLTGTKAGTFDITVLVDGNAFSVAPIQVTMTADNIDTTKSTLTAAPEAIEANGRDTARVTLTLCDSNDNPVTGQSVALATTLGTLGAVTEGPNGVYTATLTAGTVAGVASLTTTVGGTALGVTPATVTLNGNSGDLSPTNSTLTAAPGAIEANGHDTARVTLTLRDSNDNPVSGQSVALATTLGALGAVSEGPNGVYTATLTAGTVAGVASLTTTVGGTALGVTPATVTLNGNSGDLSPTNSTLTAAPGAIEANGHDTARVTLTLRDSNDNPVSGQSVALATTLGTLGAVSEGPNGVYTATLTAGTVAGVASLTTTVGGTALGVTPATVTLNGNSGDLSPTNSTLTAAPGAIEANGHDTARVTLTLRDSNDNPVSGQTVALATTLGTLGPVSEGPNGVYTATLTAGTVAGVASLTTTVGGTALGVTPATVTLNGNSGDLSPTNSTLTAAPGAIEANGHDTARVTLTLRDSNDNPVSGQSVALATTLGTLGAVSEGPNGVYTATLTAGTVAGVASLTTTVGGTALGVTPATVTLNGNSGDLSPTNSTLTAAPGAIEANGRDTARVTLTLRDSNDNPVSGQSVALATTLGTLGAVSEGPNGVYTATLTAGTVAGVASLTTTVGGSALGVTPATVTLNGNSGDLSPTNSTLTAAPGAIEANGRDTARVTLTLRDSNDNPVTGQSVALATTLGTLGPVSEGPNGVYTATLTAGTVAGVASLTTTVGGTALAVTPATVTLNGNSGDLSPTNSTLTAAPGAIEANGRDTARVTLTLRDSNDNPVTGQSVALATTLGTLGPVSEGPNGVYTATLTAGTVAGVASLTTTVGGTALGVTPATVTLNGNSGDLSPTNSTLTAAPGAIEANGRDTARVTLTLRDSNDNPVSGQSVALATTLGTLGPVSEGPNGVYTATLTAGTVAGVASLTTTVGGTALAVTPATVTLNGNSGDLSPTNSTLTAAPGAIEANGRDTARVTLTLRDSNDNPVSGQSVALATTLGTLGPVSEGPNGVYTATLTAGTVAGVASLTTTVGGTALGVTPATVTLNGNSGDLSPTNSTLTAAPGAIEANGHDTARVTLTLRDSNDNPVSGQSVALATTLGTLGAVSEGPNGVYTATLTAGTVAGVASLTTTVGGTALGVTPATVTLNGNSGDLSPTKSTLTAAPGAIEANGHDTARVTLTLRDSNDNPVTGQTVALVTTLGALGAVSEGPNGVYTATLTAGTVAGVASLTTTVGGTALGVTPATVTLNGNSGDLSPTNSTLTAAPGAIEANGHDTARVTLTLRDSNDNPVSGQSVALATTLGALGAVSEGPNGVYTATLTAGTVAGVASLTTTVGGTALGVTPATVTLNGNSGDLSPTKSTLTAAPGAIEANGHDTARVTLTLRDSNDNPVSGQSVALATTLGALGAVSEGPNGVYTATLTAGTVAGVASLTTTVGGTALEVTPATVTLNGNSGDLSPTKSTLTAAPGAIEANGRDTARVTLTLRDSNDNPVTGQSVALATTLGTLGAVSEGPNGVYTATLTAGTVAGVASLTTTVGGTALGVTPATVTINGDSHNLSPSLSSLVATPTSLVVTNNVATTSTLAFTLKDANNNLVRGQAVTFNSSSSSLGTIGSVTEISAGVYRATFTSKVASGTVRVSVNVNSTAFNVTAVDIPITTILNTSPNVLGSPNIPAGYDLVVFSFYNGNWFNNPVVLPATGAKDGNKITITSQAIFDAFVSSANTNLSANLTISTNQTVSFAFDSGKWIRQGDSDR